MLYEFKSRATGTLMMTETVAETILEIIGKAPGPKGIILPEQMPKAIEALNAAVAQERQAAKPQPEPDPADEARQPVEPIVTLAQRAFPFIDMLRRAHAAGKEITWGV